MSKRKHFSKALTILLAVVMVFTMMPAMAWADGGGSDDPVTLPDASITVPSDAELFVGSKPGNKHYVTFTEISAVQQTENANAGTTTYYFDLTNNSAYNYRVSGENYVTYAGTFKKTADYSLNVTEEMLKPEGVTKDTIDRDVKSNNGYNVADIYLNINPQGYLKLDSIGATYQIVNLRNWEAVDSTTNNYFIEPDYHYTVIDEAGNPSSNVVAIDEKGLITAEGEGTAIVLVTYDAINIPTAVGGPFFGAIWPENTGVFVVSVGAEESGIDTGMTINEELNNPNKGKNSGNTLDAEHDVIYYVGEEGKYTFIPKTNDVSVYVANPNVTDTMTFNGYTAVKNNSDGSYTVPLIQGRNIVKIEKDGKSEYQIITAKRIEYTINDGEPVRKGDAISIQFNAVYNPINKLAGLYNYNACITYNNVDGYEGKIIGAKGAQYNFASSNTAQNVTNILKEQNMWGAITLSPDSSKQFIVPEDYEKDIFRLSEGAIFFGGWGDYAGNHRGITYEEGRNPNLNAGSPMGFLGKLPDIEIPIAATDAELSRIDLTTENVKLNYYEGEAFDASNLVVTAVYEDEVTQIATNYTVTPERLSTDTTTVTINYRGKTATIPVTVNERKIESIAVTKVPSKTVYTVGDAFNPSGIEITATYEGGVKKDVTDSVTYSDTVFNASGDDVKVTVSYTEKGITKTTTQSVKVNEASSIIPADNITVSFTLLGDDKHGEPTEATGTHTLKNHNLKTWIAKTNVSIPKGSKVIDVIEKALGMAGIPFTNPSGNYIDTIRGIGEFSNGNLSGWMYTLNGVHPGLGVAEQIVANGDAIVLHYTDDYTVEQGSEVWGTPTATGSSVTTSGTSGSAATTTPTEVAVSGDTAKATIKTENATEAIKQAKENKSAEIVIEVSNADIKTAEKVQVEIPTATAKEILNATTADLTLKTPVGTVTVPRDALKGAIAEAKGITITVEVAAVSKPTDIQKKAAGTNGQIFSVTMKSGNTVISTFGGKSLKLKSEVPTKLKGKRIAAIHIAADGKVEKLQGKIIKEGTKEYYEFATTHLSTFALVDADEIGLETEEPVEEEQTKLEKIKAGVKATTLTARSSKTKNGIKVTWTKSKGYKVDYYEVFRSTKKNTAPGSKPIYTTKNAKNPTKTYYVNNKNLKKGTTYYYTVRGVRIVDGKKVYTQLSKKAIRTA